MFMKAKPDANKRYPWDVGLVCLLGDQFDCLPPGIESPDLLSRINYFAILDHIVFFLHLLYAHTGGFKLPPYRMA